MFPEKDETSRLFYELFRIFPEQQKKKVEWKKNKKGKPARLKDLRKPKVEYGCSGAGSDIPTEVEVAGNASTFAVYATVRLAVLERCIKEAAEMYLAGGGSSITTSGHQLPAPGSDSEDDGEKGSLAALSAPTPDLPKIVGFGLRSVFELIRESRLSHPPLCAKALVALLDIVQGHQPEALKNEPSQVIEPLLELLLDLATLPPGESGSGLTAVACSCLLALVVARADTGKLLSAVAALLMCPRPIANQTIQMPSILASLQKSVHGVVLGKTVAPDWITHGIPVKSLLFTFTIDKWESWSKSGVTEKSLASDGQYLYIHTNRGLYKVGSGYGGTIRGHVYGHKKDVFTDSSTWMGFAQNKLVVRVGERSSELMMIDRQNLEVKEVGRLDLPGVLFSDGEYLGLVTPNSEDEGFSIRTLNPHVTPLTFVSELPLSLVQKCTVSLGWEDECVRWQAPTGNDDHLVSIATAKEFTLVTTAAGKVLYSGKGSALGVKSIGTTSAGQSGVVRWCELPVGKAARITHAAVGHDGLHAVLVSDDGAAYFTGTARRGEDGDHNKVRRQPKAVKPKKIAKAEGLRVVYAACNNGTTALVTAEGELYMYGKDTLHCDSATGVVIELKGVHVSQVSLGKAHAVAITDKGHLYTFGINNKGQCARDFPTPVKEVAVMAMEVAGEEEGGWPGVSGEQAGSHEDEWEEVAMCPPGQHKWKQDLCMVCTVCRECTGYSISCLSSMRPHRAPAQVCGCGEGDSGCSVCGCCRICAKENLDNSEMAILGPSGASDIAGMMRLDLIFGGRQGSRLQDHLQLRLEERKQRQRAKLAGKHSSLKMKTSTRAGSSGPSKGPFSPPPHSKPTTSQASQSPSHHSVLGNWELLLRVVSVLHTHVVAFLL